MDCSGIARRQFEKKKGVEASHIGRRGLTGAKDIASSFPAFTGLHLPQRSVMSSRAPISVASNIPYALYISCSQCKITLKLRSSQTTHLVLACSSLARLELVKVPAADREAALVLVHTPLEVADVVLADLRRLVV